MVTQGMSTVIVLLLALCYLHQCSSAGEYCVRPPLEHECDCPSDQLCLTLSEYIQNSTTYFTSNATFHFLPGTHTVTEARSVVIRDVHSLVFDSYGLSQQLPATVDCTRKRLMFAFVEVEDLHISDLHFLNCGLEVPTDFLLHDVILDETVGRQHGITPAALLFVNVTSLVLENVSVRKSYGYGLLSWNSVTVSVVGCSFRCNNWRAETNHSYDNCRKSLDKDSKSWGLEDIHFGGNALFLVSDSNKRKNGECVLNISNSEFSYGMALEDLPQPPLPLLSDFNGAGLTVYYKTESSKHLHVYNCTFYGNRADAGANMFVYNDVPSTGKAMFVIDNCTFYNGISSSDGGGLFIANFVENQVDLNANITKSKFLQNHAEFGSGFILLVDANDNSAVTGYDVTYHHITINIESCNFSNNTGKEGSGIHIMLEGGNLEPYHMYVLKVTVSKAVFQENTAELSGGGIFILYTSLQQFDRYTLNPSCIYSYTDMIDAHSLSCSGLQGDFAVNMVVTESNFTDNIAVKGSALYIADSKSRCMDLSLSNINVYSNHGLDPQQHNSAAVHVENVTIGQVTISNSDFIENMHTAVLATDSNLYLAGQVWFVGNRGYSGGALALIEHPLLYLDPDASVYIIENTALHYGGGIVVTTDCLGSYMDYCFFQLAKLNMEPNLATVTLVNNSANAVGNSIYGGCLDSCYLSIYSIYTSEVLSRSEFFDYFVINNETQSQSEIASKPYKVCFCPSTFTGQSCQNTSNTTVFRGQTFQKEVIGSGQYGYASPAVIRVSVSAGFTGELGERQSIQEVGKRCGNITLSIRTLNESTKLELSVESSSISSSRVAILTVSFLPCPFGFDLKGDPPKCDCADHLRKPGVNCSIDNQLVYRPAAVWIGNYSNDVVIHSHCPFDYCKTEGNEISLHQQDEQCALNHARVLCGACQPGLSLALGSSRCMQCSNVWILLFVPFTVAGVALVILLLKCNLTVSTGTINGLIFYANIIRVNHSIFFPPGKINPATQTLAVFIAWVNLDLGIETCLFEGMTAFIKTWLQFLFPIYIWVMVGLMIIVSRYSTTVSRLTGYNTVSVLATLFLLSYAKLLRTITTTLSFTTLSDRNGHTSAVWLLDGNVGFLKGPHIALFIGSLLALLGFVLPFALLVLLAPFLQASTHYHVQKLVNKFKPLLDVYQGPYKDKFRFWTGFMLWVRIVLFTAFASNALGDPQVNLFVIILLVIFLVVLLLKTGGVYKNSINEVVEWFFLLNLGTFAASTQFLRSLDNFSVKRQEIVTGIMVGSAFSVFLGILAYHCYGYLTKAGVVDWMHVHFKPRPALQQDAQPDADGAEFNGSGAQAQDAQPTFTEIRLDELREPLMTDN